VGKATIVDEQGEGLYTISLDYGSDIIAQRRAPIQAELDAFQIALDQLEPELAAANAAANIAKDNLDAAINALDPESIDYSLVNKASADLAEKGQEVAKLESRQRFIKVTIANAEKRLAELDSEPVTETTEAWCATYTEGATGAVATIEIDGEKKPPLIAPADPDTGELNNWSAADGVLVNRLAVSPSSTFYNTALLPGWQKYRPTYRIGVISNISTASDTCTVTLIDATSSAQGLDINQEQKLSGVPIEYLNCNAAAFENDDRVVVKFEGQQWEQPKVIGFESNPRPCSVIWVSANRKEVVGSNEAARRVTAKLKPDTLEVIGVWQFDTTRYSNGVAATSGYRDALISTSSGGVRDATTGAAVFNAPFYSSDSWGSAEVAVGSGRLFVSNPATNLIYAYEWPGGSLVGTIPRPVSVINGSMAADESALIVSGYDSLGGFPANHITTHVYDAKTLALLWSASEGIDGSMLQTDGAAISSDYAAVIIWYDDASSSRELVVRNAANGALVRTLSVPSSLSNSSVGIAIRGRDGYLLTLNRATGSGHQRSVFKFDLISGSPTAPSASASNIFSPYVSSSDGLLGDFGSID